MKHSASAVFRFKACQKGNVAVVADHPVRCHNVAQRGTVPLPLGWPTALRATALPAIAARTAERARLRERCYADIQCEVLGVAKEVPAFIGASSLSAGQSVTLRLAGQARGDVALCAHVEGARWMCHAGTFEGCDLSQDNPFRLDGLALRDIERDAWIATSAEASAAPPKKRVKPHAKFGGLQDAIAKHPAAFATAVAVATWRAEQLRAHLESREMDGLAAASQLERSPWHYSGTSGAASAARVVFLWSCRRGTDAASADAPRQYHIVTPMLQDVLQRRSVPMPPAFADAHLHECLVDAAESEGRHQKSPCKYLGAMLSPGTFEADPAKWPSHAHDKAHGKASATVCFEWLHCQRGTSTGLQPHRVFVRADKIVHDKRPLPQNPLGMTAPGDLHFSVAFMHEVARNAKQGVSYKGVALEGERPDFLEDVPDSGRDIQDAPVHWCLPSGKYV